MIIDGKYFKSLQQAKPEKITTKNSVRLDVTAAPLYENFGIRIKIERDIENSAEKQDGHQLSLLVAGNDHVGEKISKEYESHRRTTESEVPKLIRKTPLRR